MQNKRTTALVLAVIGVVLVMVGVFGHSYWTASDERSSGGVGVREVEECRKDECRTASLSDLLGKEQKAFVYSGTFTFYFGLLAALGGLIAAGLVFAQRPVRGPVSPARLSLVLFGLTAIAAIVFFASAPSGLSKELSFGMGLPLTLAGAACGVVGMLFLDQVSQTMQPMQRMPMGGPAMMPMPGAPMPMAGAPQAAVPACAQCGSPTVWVAEHNRYYCTRCSVYI